MDNTFSNVWLHSDENYDCVRSFEGQVQLTSGSKEV